ncbi:MAG: sigma 54-interacting transcriptional regulator [Candidatus Accumulibacter sp.]|jgi:transcriptional regulator with PAS, ATPase and Fis domain|nr:sigma 54-interacting transcriptional regulator [Accumulibacter sp.]
MQSKKRKVAIIWSGTIKDTSVLDADEVVIFQDIGVDDVNTVLGHLDFGNISAVICAPGIAAEIRPLIPVPLIVSYPTYIDILETIQYAELALKITNQKFALVLHEQNRIHEDRLAYFVHNAVDLYHYRTKSDLRGLLAREAFREYALIIGGPTAVRMAKFMNFNAVQIIYREEALQSAYEKTRELLNLMDKEILNMGRLRTVLDIIPDGIIETDVNGVIRMCNRNALSMLGLSGDQVLGADICDLTSDNSWMAVLQGDVSQVDQLITYKHNKFFSTRQPIIDGGKTVGLVGILQKASKIQGMESKFRFQQNKGMVATYSFDDVVSESPVMQEIIERAKIYAQYDTTILLEGETGTGKEIFAQSIHNAGSKKHGPFVAINCATLTETLLESELMGYDEGAFTGARRGGKPGLFERAHKGTIFLDEINQLPPSLQGKLLRVIQEKSVMHVGGDSVIPVDVRIIAATNENLKKKVADQTLRSDLYYRRNVLSIVLPPLRERREDIEKLMLFFVQRFDDGAGSANRHVQTMLKLVEGYTWPGNIRELQNFVERYMILRDRVDHLDKHFFQELFNEAPASTPKSADVDAPGILTVRIGNLENMTTSLIREMVRHCGGNKSRAALMLDVSRNTIHQRLRSDAAIDGARAKPDFCP